MTNKTKEPDNEPLLSLETLAPKRPTIEIDDEAYELRTLNDLNVVEQSKRERDATEFKELYDKKTPTKADSKRLKQLLDRLFNESLIAPEEVKAKLSDHQRQQVVITFSVAPAMAQLMKEEREKAENGSTLES